MSRSAAVSEIYASIQGEGPYAGERQIFVRLAGCPLRCRYCDTPKSLVATGHPRLSLAQVLQSIGRLRRSRISTVSATGGEPLLQSEFLFELFAELKKRRMRTYLETSGIHAAAMKRLRPVTDVISMDIKLPSAVGRPFWTEHQAFLTAAGKNAFVKIVWEERSSLAELKKALSIVAACRPVPVVVLQPVSPVDKAVRPPMPRVPSPEHLADAYSLIARTVPRVMVLPQLHKIWGVR